MTGSRRCRLGSVLVFTAVCCAIAGCGSAKDSSNANAGGAGESNDSTAAPDASSATRIDACSLLSAADISVLLGVTVAAPDASSATRIDACSLLSAADISVLLGVTVEGKSTGTDPELAGCKWENPANYESVSLEISNPGTAPNNTLPPPEPGFPAVGTPGPDGMRFLGSGMVEFPAGGRSNTVQVAVLSLLGDDANDAAVGLARKIAPQIPE
jgi:hypothetical protein